MWLVIDLSTWNRNWPSKKADQCQRGAERSGLDRQNLVSYTPKSCSEGSLYVYVFSLLIKLSCAVQLLLPHSYKLPNPPVTSKHPRPVLSSSRYHVSSLTIREGKFR